MLVKRHFLYCYIRASPTHESNEELNIKKYNFSFYLFISSLQRSTQTNSYFGYLFTSQPFLHFPAEMVKTNNCWPTAIFIAVGQQLFFKKKIQEKFSLNGGGKNL